MGARRGGLKPFESSFSRPYFSRRSNVAAWARRGEQQIVKAMAAKLRGAVRASRERMDMAAPEVGHRGVGSKCRARSRSAGLSRRRYVFYTRKVAGTVDLGGACR